MMPGKGCLECVAFPSPAVSLDLPIFFERIKEVIPNQYDFTLEDWAANPSRSPKMSTPQQVH